MTQQRLVFLVVLIEGCHMLAWNDEKMNRRLGIDVVKCDAHSILIQNLARLLARGDLAENASEHFHHPFLVRVEEQLLDGERDHLIECVRCALRDDSAFPRSGNSRGPGDRRDRQWYHPGPQGPRQSERRWL